MNHSIVNHEIYGLIIPKTPFTKDIKDWTKTNPISTIFEFSYREHQYIALYMENSVAITHAGHCPCRDDERMRKTEEKVD